MDSTLAGIFLVVHIIQNISVPLSLPPPRSQRSIECPAYFAGERIPYSEISQSKSSLRRHLSRMLLLHIVTEN